MRIRSGASVFPAAMAMAALICGFGPHLPAQSSPAQSTPAQSAPAQPAAPDKPEAPAPAATLKIQANEVVVPVTVRDKHGALVASLKMSDFSLTEDGRPQTIKSFTRESNLPFRLGLLVDTSRSVSSALDNERKAAEKFVDQMLPADPDTAKQKDEAFLIHFDHEVELLEDFTNSREKLHRELDDMGPTRAENSSSQGPETSDSEGRSQSHGRGGTQLYDAIYLACHELMQTKDGRKALVVFSDGADRGSKETLNDAVDAADRANVAIYTIYFKGEQENNGFGNGYPGGRRGGMGGGGYPGGGGGWPGGGGGGGRRGPDTTASNGQDGKKIMEKIAVRTGARYFEAKKKDNLDEIYAQIAEELRGQYLLTYTPDKLDTDGGFHKIALKASKDDLIVVTREGYYAPGGDSK
ncbi:MAG: VWA domain-containing protein [Terracidiphilus sp.]